MRPPRNSAELTQAQCEQLEPRAFESLRFLRKLLTRIEQCKFPVDDKFRQDVEAAYSAVLGLRMTLRYLACDRQRSESERPKRTPDRDTYREYLNKRKG